MTERTNRIMEANAIEIGKSYWHKGLDIWVKALSLPRPNYDNTDTIIRCKVVVGNSDYFNGETIFVYGSELRKMFTTVGELIEKLKKHNPNKPVTMRLTANDSDGRHSIAHYPYHKSSQYGSLVDVDADGSFVSISNAIDSQYEYYCE